MYIWYMGIKHTVKAFTIVKAFYSFLVQQINIMGHFSPLLSFHTSWEHAIFRATWATHLLKHSFEKKKFNLVLLTASICISQRVLRVWITWFYCNMLFNVGSKIAEQTYECWTRYERCNKFMVIGFELWMLTPFFVHTQTIQYSRMQLKIKTMENEICVLENVFKTLLQHIEWRT